MGTGPARLLAVVLGGLLLAGCGGSGKEVVVACDEPIEPSKDVVVVCDPAFSETETEPRRSARKAAIGAKPTGAAKAARSPRVGSLARLAGRHSSIAYPVGWRVETAEAWNGSYHDTTIRNPQSPATYLRVDVSPGRRIDPAAHAAEVEAYLRRQDGYRRIGFERTTFARQPAFRWEFTVLEGGVRLRKVDVFVRDPSGNAIAVLTQAPASLYPSYAPLFEQLRASVVPRSPVSR